MAKRLVIKCVTLSILIPIILTTGFILLRLQQLSATAPNEEQVASDYEPGDVKKQPGDVKKQPGDLKKQPGDVKQPGDLKKQPDEPGDIKQPGDVKKQPGDVKKQPGDVKKQPGDVKKQPGDVKPISVKESVEKCMKAVHLDSETSLLLPKARSNAKYFVNEFRKVIPWESLHGYKSHCWKEAFSLKWTSHTFSGNIGNLSFNGSIGKFSFNGHLHERSLVTALTKKFPLMKYTSNMTCLPNLFLAGFPKCGSTFLYCFINRLMSISMQHKSHTDMEVEKEPHFWVPVNTAKSVYLPTAYSIGNYFLNFLPGFQKINKYNRTDILLLDGSPNILFNWPRFKKSEHNLTNYCLIPSILPHLLPNSKYVVVMRNPISMLYSAFWFSCATKGKRLSLETKLMAPNLFHSRVESKINIFNNCMRDASAPLISQACVLDDKHNYSACILQRLHLLDRCVHEITFHITSPELPECGRCRVAIGMYFVHIRKWLSVVPHERFFFLTLEDLHNPFSKTASNNILEFLGFEAGIAAYPSIVGARSSCNKNAQDYGKDPRLKMREDTRVMLEHFYYPFNSLLAELLGDKKYLW